ncbi:MAG TPA: LysR family transcriptional regulator [Microbacterium sp.]|nr:LysR family transcriptional regulator [Microbacterium sp.]
MGWPCDPRLLATLEAVARRGSFEAAGAELGRGTSEVAREIGELERLVGARVVTRDPVCITQPGRALMEAEAATTAAMSRAAAELRALAAGTGGQLRVGAFAEAAASFVPTALARVHAVHPEVRITLRVLGPDASHLALLCGELDLAVTFYRADDPHPVPEGIVRLHLGPLPHPAPSRHLYTCRLLTGTSLAAARTLTDRLADAVAGMQPPQRGSGE